MNLLLAILLTWSDASNPAAKVAYHVERGARACATATFARLTVNTLPARQYSDTSPPGTWCYRVVAVVDGVESDPSTPVQVSTKPAAPTDLKATAPASPG